MLDIFKNLFDSNDKQLKTTQPIIDKINELEEYTSKLSDEQLKAKTKEFRKKLKVDLDTVDDLYRNTNEVEVRRVLDNKKEQLREILPEAFAVVREASNRITKHRHFDVQVMAGYFLFEGRVVELFTGEGKTLAANLPLYLFALTGHGSHLVTVNDYLARRDAEWNGHILNALGMSVSAINGGVQYRYISDEEAIKLKGKEAKKEIKERDEKAKKYGRLKYDHMSGINLIECTKKEAYDCDVVYGTNNEYGFDYLRDNMAQSIESRVQRPLHFVIVDEADSILVDEARTPLIISTNADASNDLYKTFSMLVNKLEPEKHYTVDEKARAVSILDSGIDLIEKELKIDNVYENSTYAYHLENALKAKELYERDDEYLVRNGEVMIVDEFTGRVMVGRRYSEGLHQAIEAKEGVEVKRESKTLATITLQNYFRIYSFLSGMTATALTEAEEFSNIYGLDTIVVPTNKPVIRQDYPDTVYRTLDGKYRAIVRDVIEHNEKGQPVLVGTTSVEKSEIISQLLSKEGVKHNVLNAKYHEKEAEIVSQAGQKGQVTIATNMAGRGTDISLGEGVLDLGGLYVIGSERHEARRIDNQLRGRSGRQGDIGSSTFYVSFEDDLMRLFGGDNMGAIMSRVGMDDDMPISLGILGKSIESAQKKVEARNYDIRKNLVEYDDVLNRQRDIVYNLRSKILSTASAYDNAKDEGKRKLNVKDLLDIDIQEVLDGIDQFSLSQDDSWNIDTLSKFPTLNIPTSLWILKRLVNHTRYIVSSQLQDDMKIDNIEERKLISQIQSIVSEDLLKVVSKLLGYKDELAFWKEFDKETDLVKKEMLLMKIVISSYVFHTSAMGVSATAHLTKILILQSLDNLWMEHLDTMSDVREGISLRQMAQKNPLVEYKNEGFMLFDKMLDSIDNMVVTRFFKVRVVQRSNIPQGEATHVKAKRVGEDDRPGETSKPKQIKSVGEKVGRNDPCPCGSGKKYKKCGLINSEEHRG